MRKFITIYSDLFIISGLLIVLDQWIKYLVRINIAIGQSWVPWSWLEPFVRIVHWKNTGAAFGMLQSFGGLFTILAIVVSLAILYYFPQVPHGDWSLRLAMCLQLGGAVGNLIDRLTIGWVTDYLSIWILPIFNLADASITLGVVVLLAGVWWKERSKTHSHPTPAATTLDTTTIQEQVNKEI